MKKLLAIAVPVLPGKTYRWKLFVNELNGKWRNEFMESRDRLDVKERVFFQSGPGGDMAVVTLEGENPEEAFARFGQGQDEFTMWFVDQVRELHGLDLTQSMPIAFPELVIES